MLPESSINAAAPPLQKEGWKEQKSQMRRSDSLPPEALPANCARVPMFASDRQFWTGAGSKSEEWARKWGCAHKRGKYAHLHRDLANRKQQQQANADAQASKHIVVQHKCKCRARVALHDASEHVEQA